MSDFGLIINNGIIVGDNTAIIGNTLSIAGLVTHSVSSNIAVTTSESVIDTSSTSITRSIKYLLQVYDGVDCQTSKLLLIHNGADSTTTEYDVLTTSQLPLVTFSADILNGTARLKATMNNLNNGVIYFKKFAINSVPAEQQLNPVALDRFGNIILDRFDNAIETRVV